jgi:hypothetical protein
MLHYHGTSLGTAQALVANPATVSVSRGGGELGKGFYTGDHVALAAAWARGRVPRWAVLEISVDVSDYVSLAPLVLSWSQVVNTWNQLKVSGMTHTYVFGYDVVYGPLATFPHAGQHKFESSTAETVLGRSSWKMV